MPAWMTQHDNDATSATHATGAISIAWVTVHVVVSSNVNLYTYVLDTAYL